jgi:hypothetical protein
MTLKEWAEYTPTEEMTLLSSAVYEKYGHEEDRAVHFEIGHGDERGLVIRYYDISLNDEGYKEMCERLEKFFAAEGKSDNA